MMPKEMLEPLARVYAAAYLGSSKRFGSGAFTDPEEARMNAEKACCHFIGALKRMDQIV